MKSRFKKRLRYLSIGQMIFCGKMHKKVTNALVQNKINKFVRSRKCCCKLWQRILRNNNCHKRLKINEVYVTLLFSLYNRMMTITTNIRVEQERFDTYESLKQSALKLRNVKSFN